MLSFFPLLQVFMVVFTAEGKDIPLRAESEAARYSLEWRRVRREMVAEHHSFVCPRNKWVKVMVDAAIKYARIKKQEKRLQRSEA